MTTLMRLYRETGERKYLEPIPRALEYYRSLLLEDGQLARFYELGTDRPLYFTKDYELTYSDADMPTHYGFKVGDGTASIQREYERLSKLDPAELAGLEPVSARDQLVEHSTVPLAPSPENQEARQLMADLAPAGSIS